MATIDLKVWAPRAESVWLHAWGKKLNLVPCAHFQRCGEWYFDWSLAAMREPLEEYLLSVDDGPPRPDPRSAWQPHGYDGPSRLVDHRQFQWSDRPFQAKPLSAAIIYELHIGTFTSAGTFEAAIERLD